MKFIRRDGEDEVSAERSHYYIDDETTDDRIRLYVHFFLRIPFTEN